MQRLNALKETILPWDSLSLRLDDVRMLVDLALSEDDPAEYAGEVAHETADIIKQIDRLEIETLLSGPHDESNAYLEINAGAGGAEANDWANMLLRAYLRWAERRGFKAEVLDIVDGDVAGLKSVTVYIQGHNAYGLLQGERGVH